MSDRRARSDEMTCEQWEALLADVLDGTLAGPPDGVGEGAARARFEQHAAACPQCRLLMREAEEGRLWLGYIEAEPEVPSALVARILEKTSGRAAAGLAAGLPGEPAYAAVPGVIARSRFSGLSGFSAPGRMFLTAAMAFFSIAVTLSVSGVRLQTVRAADLRPAALRNTVERQVVAVSTPVVRYYDHLRFVYEVESRMHELERDAEREERSRQQRSRRPAAPGGSSSAPRPGSGNGGRRASQPAPPARMVLTSLTAAKQSPCAGDDPAGESTNSPGRPDARRAAPIEARPARRRG